MGYWQRLREALLDFAWRDKYTRWYLILMSAWWIALWAMVPRLVDVTQNKWWALAALPLGWLGQYVTGKVCNTLQEWNEGEMCDCPTCTEQRTGGAA